MSSSKRINYIWKKKLKSEPSNHEELLSFEAESSARERIVSSSKIDNMKLLLKRCDKEIAVIEVKPTDRLPLLISYLQRSFYNDYPELHVWAHSLLVRNDSTLELPLKFLLSEKYANVIKKVFLLYKVKEEEYDALITKIREYIAPMKPRNAIMDDKIIKTSPTMQASTESQEIYIEKLDKKDEKDGEHKEEEKKIDNRAMPGYLQSLSINKDRGKIKNLEHPMEWKEIKMLSVITGKNGVGKTAILEAIVNGVNEALQLQQHQQSGYSSTLPPLVSLSFLDKSIPEVFARSSSIQNMNQIQDKSDEKFRAVHEDLMAYNESKRYKYKSGYILKFPVYNNLYDKIIEALDNKLSEIEYDRFKLHMDIQTQLKLLLEDAFGPPVSVYGSLEKYPAYLFKRTSLDEINKHLTSKNFKYCISDDSLDYRGSFQSLRVRLRLNSFHTPPAIIPYSYLSPGEQTELLTLLWLFEQNKIKRNQNGTILLFDEPDAHLHPGLVKEVLESIFKLIRDHHVQVIMTTHSPTTVSLVPSECIYVMSGDKASKNIEIQQAKNKKQAIQLLTSDFVYVNEPFRMVFVEAHGDVLFYNHVKKNLVNIYNMTDISSQILFIAHGEERKESGGKVGKKKMEIKKK